MTITQTWQKLLNKLQMITDDFLIRGGRISSHQFTHQNNRNEIVETMLLAKLPEYQG